MNKDTKKFLEYIGVAKDIIISSSGKTHKIIYSLYNRNSDEVTKRLETEVDKVIKRYFKENSKASFYRVISDKYWNNKASYVSYYSLRGSEEHQNYSYAIKVVTRIVDLLSSDIKNIEKIIKSSTGLWTYLSLSYINNNDISSHTMKKLLYSKDRRVLGYAINNCTIKHLIERFEGEKIRNKNTLRKYNKRMKDAGISPRVFLEVSSFTQYQSLYDLLRSVNRSSAIAILDFYSNNKEEILEGSNYSWHKRYHKQILEKALSFVSDENVFSYVNLDIDIMYKRKQMREIIGF